tara:strand:- start:16177 stop:16836 length:660 start_codon:yes stop_codon:yes gene_type:complete
MKFLTQILTLTIISLFALQGLGEVVYSQITYTPDPSSRLWIEGRSNINEFQCQANQYFAEASLIDNNDQNELQQEEQEQVFLQVEIRVDGFECGKNRMNRDLQDALKSSEYPEITFMFASAEILEMPSSHDQAFELEVEGSLTVAGNTRDIRFNARAYFLESHKVRAIGNTTIKMSDFDVEPPTALMGLIKADDELTVNFDLIASETDAVCQLCPTSKI